LNFYETVDEMFQQEDIFHMKDQIILLTFCAIITINIIEGTVIQNAVRDLLLTSEYLYNF